MDLLKNLKEKGVKNIKVFDKGRRGVIYIGIYKNKKVAIKIKREDSKAKGRIKNEAKFLKILNKYKIGPRLIFGNKDYIMYEFVKGKFILEFLKEKKNIKKIILDILEQCYIMDKIKINKLEMHHPIKHIIIDKKPVLIDFERAYYTKRPKNLTQFFQFLMTRKDIFGDFNPKIVEILKEYKKKPTKTAFLKLKKAIFKK